MRYGTIMPSRGEISRIENRDFFEKNGIKTERHFKAGMIFETSRTYMYITKIWIATEPSYTKGMPDKKRRMFEYTSFYKNKNKMSKGETQLQNIYNNRKFISKITDTSTLDLYFQQEFKKNDIATYL